MSKGKWTKKFPDKVGHYWFYGYRYGKYKRYDDSWNEPEFNHVVVRKCANGLMHIADGQFMYEAEFEQGHFMPIDLPKVPKLDE